MSEHDHIDGPDDAGPPFGTADAERFRPLLIRYFRRHRADEADVEDLAQEALLRLLRSP
ncbi:MAG: hypothetical protein KA124_15220, partial [Luteimonas sp.]|nr:hypothetical protein [Luteimonas sp.]